MKTKRSSPETPALPRRDRRRRQIIVACAAAALILAAAVLILVKVLPGGGGQSGQERRSEGFPYSINSNLVRDMQMLGPELLLLTDESVTVLDSSGKEVSRMPHTYKRPAMDVRDGRLLIYDRGGRKLRIQNRKKILLEKELKADIITCAVGDSGNFAVASRAVNAACLLTVYDKNVNEIFKWRSSKDYIMDIALSGDGKYAAAVVMGSEAGKLYSRAYVFDLSNEKPLAELDYPEASLFDVTFSGKSTILVAGDILRGVIENRTKKADPVSYGTGELRCFSASQEGMSATILSEYGSINANDLIVCDEAGREMFRHTFEQEVRGVSCDGGSTAVLLAGSVRAFDNKGRQIGHFAVRSDALRVVVNGRSTYVLSMGELDRLNTRDNALDK